VAPEVGQEDAVTDFDDVAAPAEERVESSLAARIDAASRLHGGEWRAWMMRRLPRVAAGAPAEEEPVEG
jgi:hypothetical protein